jgi:hypothetical protein
MQVADKAPAGPTPAMNPQPQATISQWQASSIAAPAAAPTYFPALTDTSSDSSSSDSSSGDVMSLQQTDMMAPAVQPEADAQDNLDYAEGMLPMQRQHLNIPS